MTTFSHGIILMAGIAILGGTLGASLFRRIKVPQVVGYIVAGLIIGQSGFKLVSSADITGLEPFNMLALAVIGFLVGSEIHIDSFRKYGKQFSSILFLEGVLAFTLTGIATGFVLYAVSNSLSVAVAGGVVFGAIASATDPAATMSVLWEYRTAGVFTTTLIAVIALDDALAMALYGIGTGISQVLGGTGGYGAIVGKLLHVFLELGGAVLIGVITGELLSRLFRSGKSYESSVATATGILLFMVGIGIAFQLDIIIMAMSAGILFSNKNPHRSKRFIEYVKSLANPIYVFFFVLIGARISIGSMPSWLWAIVGLYVIIRSLGKFVGAYIGARMSNAHPVVQKNVGLGLFAQGGVAIGLSIMAAHHLDSIVVTEQFTLGDTIISAVATTTLFVQLIGPAAVKIAAFRSGEVGRAIDEEEFMNTKKVSEYLEDAPLVTEDMSADSVITLFSNSNRDSLPVVDTNKRLLGLIGMTELRTILGDRTVLPYILATDIMNLDSVTVMYNSSLSSAMKLKEQTSIDEFVVLKDECFVGVLNTKNALHQVRNELVLMKGE